MFALILGSAVASFTFDSTIDLDKIEQASIHFTLLAVALGCATYFQHVCFTTTSQRQMRALRCHSLEAILRQEMGWFDSQSNPGELATRISGDTIVIQEGIGEKFGEGICFSAQFISGFIIGFAKNWRLALVMCATIPFIAIGLGLIMFHARTAAVEGQKSYAAAGAVADEVLGSIRTVAAFSAEKSSETRFANLVAVARKIQMKSTRSIAGGVGLTMSSVFFTYALGLWYGGTLVAEGESTVGDVLSVFYAILLGSVALGKASPNLIAIGSAKGAAKTVVEICSRESKIDAMSTDGLQPNVMNLQGRIELRNLNFVYPSRPSVRVLENYSLTIEPGETCALVAESGCGKSTIVSLLQRFYDPDSGSILLDGFELSSLNIQWLRNQIGYVSQEPVLFAESIYDNIRLGSPNPTQVTTDQVIRAAKLANAHGFIETFPKGYDTIVGEWGTQVSGGQKQRIAIARAVIKDPTILLLDEATSALDNESERVVQEALDGLLNQKRRTTIVVAHRLSTIRNADKIAVMKDGSIVELGTHEVILSKYPQGEYQRLIQLQLGNSERNSSKTLSTPVVSSDQVAIKHTGIYETSHETIQDERQEKGTMARLWKLYNSSNTRLYFALLCSALSGAAFPSIALILTEYVESMRTSEKEDLIDEITLYSYLMVGLGVSVWGLRYAQLYLLSWLSERLIQHLRRSIFQSMLRQDVGWFDLDENRTGALTERLAADPPLIKNISGENFGRLIQTISTFLVAVVVAFVFGSWQITILLILILPCLVYCYVYLHKHNRFATLEVQQSMESAGNVASSTISSIRTVSSLSLAPHFIQQYNRCLDLPTQVAIARGQKGGIVFGMTLFLTMGTYGAMFYFGGRLVENGTITFDQMFRSLMVIMMAAQSIGASASYMGDQTSAKEAATRIFQIIDRVSPIDPTMNHSPDDVPVLLDGDIEFQSVSFRYPTRPETKVLDNFSLHIKRGDTVALVGTSGSGKSTIVGLIERFYDPEDGNIMINGIKISTLPVSTVRQQLGYVGQEPVLFSMSIGENIRYGKPQATDEQVVEAARLANAHDFISQLPEQYDTPVGSRSTLQLSGGQKQRIAIARAILRQPKILLLDEATSALDAASESLVQKAIDNLLESQQCTAIVIAHRLSTIRNADKIVVIEQGQVVEQGNHGQLVEIDKGYYAKLLRD